MKSKNIPVDIRAKSIKEAQNEIRDIIETLENKEVNLENSMAKYNRMLQLNYHIQDQFRKRAGEINQSTLDKNEKNFHKNLK